MGAFKPENRTIFLADDDEDDRLFFYDALKGVAADAKLQTAENGLQLMEMLRAAPLPGPDLVFLDLNMPLKSGYECLAEIRARSEWDHLPVIIISTSIQPEGVELVYEQGASLYIVKPNEFGQLRKFIEQALIMHSEGTLKVPSKEKFILRVS